MKKHGKIMPVAWHLTRWCDLCMPKDKNENIVVIYAATLATL